MARVAILHFTSPTAVGGVEALISSQVDVLRALGHDSIVVTGSRGAIPGAVALFIPALHPAYPPIVEARPALQGHFPDRDHPIVVDLISNLTSALAGCTACWVHNAFTVYLNPFLTVALCAMVELPLAMKWVAWCEDMTAISAYQDTVATSDCSDVRLDTKRLAFVAPSRARRDELRAFLGGGSATIDVIPPPVSATSWLGLHGDTEVLLAAVPLVAADIVVMVPAKLLHHKGVERLVGLSLALRTLVPRPLLLLTGAPSPHEPSVSAALSATLRRQIASEGLGDIFYLVTEVLNAVPPRAVIRDLMLLADLVLLPSTEEGFGVPLLEAFMLRTPILCTDIPVFREVGYPCAQYFDPGESDFGLATRIRDIAEESANRSRRRALRSDKDFRHQVAYLLTDPSEMVNGPIY